MPFLLLTKKLSLRSLQYPLALKKVGEYISEAMEKVGKDGVITIEESRGMETELEVVEGMQFDRGYLSQYMVTDNEKMVADLENPYIFNH